MSARDIETIRRSWRTRARAAGFLDRSVILNDSSRAKWAAVADGIAKRYANDLPEDIRSVRELQVVLRAWRLELEIAFVHGVDSSGLLDPALDTETIRNYVARLILILSNMYGGARTGEEGTAKRKRMALMRFVQLCVDGELSRWPRRSGDRHLLKLAKSLPPGLDRAAPAALDKLVATWRATKPGAKPARGHSKWRILSKVLTAAWSDETRPPQLKKEWVEGRPSIGRSRSNRYSLLVPNAADAFEPKDVGHDPHIHRRSRIEPDRPTLTVAEETALPSEQRERTAPRQEPPLPSRPRLR